MEWIKYVLESEIKRLNNCKNLSLKKLQNPQLEDTHVKHENGTIEDCDNKIKEVSTFLKTMHGMNKDTIKSAYAQYWDTIKHIVDEDGWVYTKEAPHLLDSYFEVNTGKPIEFQKSFGKSGDNPHWLTKGARWRPLELSTV